MRISSVRDLDAVVRMAPGDGPVGLSDWATVSNGVSVDSRLVTGLVDEAVAAFLVTADDLDAFGVVTRFRSRDHVARLRLLPLGDARLSTCSAETLTAVVDDVRRRLMLRKLYWYTAEPAVLDREPHGDALRLEGRLTGSVLHDGKLSADTVFACYDGPAPDTTFLPPPPSPPPETATRWTDWTLPDAGLEGTRARLDPLTEASLLGLFDAETAHASWSALGVGVTFTDYVNSVRTSAPVALAIHHRASGAVIGRVSIFGWQPRVRRARLSVFLRDDACLRAQRLAGAEGILLGVLHGAHHLGLETLVLDTTASTTSLLAGILRGFGSHDAHFPDDVCGRSGFLSTDVHSVSRRSLQQLCRKLSP